jgi:predicted nucleic acid-binding protein
VIDVLCDTSVVVKWFHEEGEQEVGAARRLLAAHRAGAVDARLLELTLYEIGNVLLRSLRWPAASVADQLDDLALICTVVAPTGSELRLAAEIADERALTFYDALSAAVARARGYALATADRALLDASAGESPAAIVARLDLPESQ